MNEVKERRKRLLKILYKKEGRLSDFEHGYKTLVARKAQAAKKYTNEQLESMLKSQVTSVSNQNLTISPEIVLCLLPSNYQSK